MGKVQKPACGSAVGFGVSLFIETAQLFTFRTSDVNDLITNTAGAFIGYFAVRLITKGFTRLTVKSARFSDFFVIFGSVTAVMFTVEPLVSLWIWNIIDR